MLPQILTEELGNAQNRNDKLQPLIWYLKDRNLSKDTLRAEKIMQQKASISSVTMTENTENHMQGKEVLFNW